MTEQLAAKLRKAASDALQVQDACNLSGVVKSFDDILQNTLWPVARELGKGTAWVNYHPVSRAFADKIASLTGTQFDMSVAIEAFRQCEELASEAHVNVA